MKFSLVFLIAVGLAGAAKASPVREPSHELNEIFLEFTNLIPTDKLSALVMDYVENDVEFQKVLVYMKSDGFRELVQKVEKIQDVIDFYDYLAEGGLAIYEAVNSLHEMIDLPPLVPGGGHSRSARRTGGAAGFIADMKALLPLDKIKALYHKKLETSKVFADFVAHIKSPRMQELVNRLAANEEFLKMLKFAKEAGVDVVAIADFLATAFGLHMPNNQPLARSDDLRGVFEEFLALVPKEKIANIAMDYLTNDAEVQAAFAYVQSEDFKKLVEQVESIQDVINFYEYLEKSGLHIYEMVNKLHDAIGLEPLVPHGNARKLTGGVAGFLADIKATLPIKDIKALYHKKLETSPAFARLVEHFKSPRFQELIDALRANPEFRKIVQFAKEAGVDIKSITDLLATMLGLEFPQRPLLVRPARPVYLGMH